ncbi:hypothetical protein N7517_010697 [Penicillium concentricum]|uniref:Uncharacterized protein n=1 Tax=Penicillium concentricum TaxID=293559 RepID=A0A9W9R9N5_9EURO|nr:uncharacterized protein N7517_010697 [Penicillium concentricum]KAJ5356088.1 hypothetical protein N7517_010697 [Penicillium concentricum]
MTVQRSTRHAQSDAASRAGSFTRPAASTPSNIQLISRDGKSPSDRSRAHNYHIQQPKSKNVPHPNKLKNYNL